MLDDNEKKIETKKTDNVYKTLSFDDYRKFNRQEDPYFGYVYGEFNADPSDQKKYQQEMQKFHEQKTKENKEFREKYGEFAANREWWGNYLNQVNEIDNKRTGDVIKGAAQKVGVDPGLLYANAMEEGMALYQSKHNYQDYINDKNFPVSGFLNYGLDYAGADIPKLIQKGLLPKNFSERYKKVNEINEVGEKVPTADFKTNEDALMAMAAVLKDRGAEISKYIDKEKPNMSQHAKDFFLSAAYNMNSTNAKYLFQYMNKKGLIDDDKLFNPSLALHDVKTYSDVDKLVDYPKTARNKTMAKRLSNMYIYARRRADTLDALRKENKLQSLQ